MNGFATGVLSALLSWVRGIASQLWALWYAPDGLGGWLTANWKALVIVLLIIGTAADITVYLLRWRPIEVWRSFFRRLRHPRPPILPDAAAQPPVEEPPEPAPAVERQPSRLRQRLQAMMAGIADDDTPAYGIPRRGPEQLSKEDAFHRPYVPPKWRHPDDNAPEAGQRRTVRRRRAKESTDDTAS